MFSEADITFSPERDGYPGIAIAFVIDEEVVYTKSFKPSFANGFLLSSPSFSSGETENIVNIIANGNSVKIAVNDMMAAILLSEPLIVQLTPENGKYVHTGWKYGNNKFYTKQVINNQLVNYYGDGTSD